MIKIARDFDEEDFVAMVEWMLENGKTVMEQRCIYRGKIVALDGKNTQEYTTKC
jgi:hypothetical protein